MVAISAPAFAGRKPQVLRLINQSDRVTDFDLQWMAVALTTQLNTYYRLYYHKKQALQVVPCNATAMATRASRKASGCAHGLPIYLRDISRDVNWSGLNTPHAWAIVDVQGPWNGDIDLAALQYTTDIADHEAMEMLTGREICDAFENAIYTVDGLTMADFALPHGRKEAAPDFCSTVDYCW